MPLQRRIGVNALYLIPGGVGGTEIYIRHLLAALAEIDHRNQYLVFTNRETGDDLCPAAANFQTVPSIVPARFRPARLIWEQTVLPIQMAQHKIDVLFSPGFSTPVVSHCGKVTVIHDLQHRRQPRNFGLFERWAWEAMVWSAVRSSDWLVTVSKNSQRDIREFYGVPRERVAVIRHGVEPAFLDLKQDSEFGESLLRQAGVPEYRYLLAVSTMHHHKNWFRLLEAYAKLVADGRPEHLVVAGVRGKAWNAVRKYLTDNQLADRVHLVGWQPREVLLGLFKFAEALVFPSMFEGFGMPVIEAMAAGLPVACSDIPPLRETADGVAEFFDPTSPDDMASAILRVLDPELRSELVRRGQERGAEFRWQTAAEQTLGVLLRAARG
jgi:glycosyltransferase involved in cell wall biosynthesis